MGLRECGVAVRCWKPSLKEQLPEGLPWSSLIPHPPSLACFRLLRQTLYLYTPQRKNQLCQILLLTIFNRFNNLMPSSPAKLLNASTGMCASAWSWLHPSIFLKQAIYTAFYFTHYLSCYHITTKHLCCFLIAFLLQLFINDAPLNYANVATDKGIIHGLGKVLEIKKNRCDINDTVITVSGSVCIDA